MKSAGGRAPLPGRDRGARRAGDAAKGRVAPLYQRLPHGPHRMDREEVRKHQRRRIHGAMIEAVAGGGYAATSVRQVIALAGVSRRSFYEQFENKQDCFLTTFDLIAGRELTRTRRAYTQADGDVEQRLRAALQTCAAAARRETKSYSLMLVAAPTAGQAALERTRRAAAACERLLGKALAEGTGLETLPAPVVRAVVGGLRGGLAGALEDLEEDPERLATEMTGWTLAVRSPAFATVAGELAGAYRDRNRELSRELRQEEENGRAQSADVRQRLVESALRLAAIQDCEELAAPQIADAAGVSVDEFMELFASREECLQVALDTVAAELLEVACDPRLDEVGWPLRLRLRLAAVFEHLARNPLHARAIAHVAYIAGPEAVTANATLAQEISSLLTAGAPGGEPSQFVRDAIAGAVWHTVRSHVASERIPLLAAVADHVSYALLAPLIGAPEAAAAVVAPAR